MSTTALEVAPRASRERLRRSLRFGSRVGGPVVLAGLFLLFTVLLPSTFATTANMQSMVAAQAVPGVLALALLLPLVAGEFDFSGGAVATASAVLVVVLLGEHGLAWPIAALIVLAAAALIGVINGILVAYLRYSSFVATLAMAGVVGGLALSRSKGQTLFRGVPSSYVDLGRGSILDVPLPAVYLLVVFVVVAFVLRQTPWGRAHESIGKGRDAARLAGVAVRRHVFMSFVGSATLAGFAGLVLVARLGSAPPNVGEAFTLAAFAAAFLGATMFRPGFFNAPGTLIAILLIAVGINGLSLAGVESYIERIFTGGVLLLAVGLSRLEQLVR